MAWKGAVLDRTEQHAMKREALLREAAAAFNRRGYRSTSLDEIAASLGVTKAALYYYFPNKQTLLAACFAQVMQAGFRSLARALAEGADGRERLHLALRYYLAETLDQANCGVVLTEWHALAPEDLAAHVAERDRFEASMRDLVSAGVADGSIAPCDPKLVMFTLFGAINWAPKWFSRSGEWTGDQLAAAMSELLDRAVAARPPPALTPSVHDFPRRSAARAPAGERA